MSTGGGEFVKSGTGQIDTFTRTCERNDDPFPAGDQYAAYHGANIWGVNEGLAWGVSEIEGIGWTEDWSATIDGQAAMWVDGSEGVIDLMLNSTGG